MFKTRSTSLDRVSYYKTLFGEQTGLNILLSEEICHPDDDVVIEKNLVVL